MNIFEKIAEEAMIDELEKLGFSFSDAKGFFNQAQGFVKSKAGEAKGFVQAKVKEAKKNFKENTEKEKSKTVFERIIRDLTGAGSLVSKIPGLGTAGTLAGGALFAKGALTALGKLSVDAGAGAVKAGAGAAASAGKTIGKAGLAAGAAVGKAGLDAASAVKNKINQAAVNKVKNNPHLSGSLIAGHEAGKSIDNRVGDLFKTTVQRGVDYAKKNKTETALIGGGALLGAAGLHGLSKEAFIIDVSKQGVKNLLGKTKGNIKDTVTSYIAKKMGEQDEVAYKVLKNKPELVHKLVKENPELAKQVSKNYEDEFGIGRQIKDLATKHKAPLIAGAAGTAIGASLMVPIKKEPDYQMMM